MIMKHIMLRVLKNAEIVYSVDKYPPFVTLTTMVLTSLDTYVVANKQCIKVAKSMGVGSGRQEGLPLLDFHTWNRYSR